MNEERLRKRIKDLFEQSSLRVKGRLINENEFSAYDKWNVIGWNMPNLKRKAAYLKGKITKGEKGTLIELIVKPNSMLPAFAIVSSLVGAVITILTLLNTIDYKFFLFLGLAFIALGVIYYPMSILLKNRLRNQVVEYLDLDKV